MQERRTGLLFVLFLFFFLFSAITTQKVEEVVSQKKKQVLIQAFLSQEEEKNIDRTGECIGYEVMFGKMRLGSAYYRQVKRTQLNSVPVNLITFETKLTSFHDLETIYCEPKTFLPFLIEREVSRLIKPEKILEEYDQGNHTVTIIRKRWTKEVTVIKKDGPIQNAILLPHSVRNEKVLSAGWSMEAVLPQRTYRIMLKNTIEIEVPAGKFRSYYFESEPQQIRIWVSADENRVPLKIEGTGVFGYRLEMKEYSPPSKN